MSMGTQSVYYQPFVTDDEAMTLDLIARFPGIPQDSVRSVLGILSDHLHTEILQIVVILELLEKCCLEQWDPDESGPQRVNILLSAVLNDGANKAQTHPMKLVHDVVVEMKMPELNFEMLQRHLFVRHGLQIATMHSCGAAMMASSDVKAYYGAIRDEQWMRTGRDATGELLTGLSMDTLVEVHGFPAVQRPRYAKIMHICGALLDSERERASATQQAVAA